jgi:hypothetical protein
MLHPEKTKIVYCKDANRRGDFPDIRFDFLGFQFRARKGDYPVLDKTASRVRWLARQASAFLISIVVLQACFSVVFAHTATFKLPTESSATLSAKNVFVKQSAPIEHLVLRPIANQSNLLSSDRCTGGKDWPAEFEVTFLPWKDSICVLDLRRGRTQHRPKLGGDLYNIGAEWAHKHIYGRRDTVIFPSYFKYLIWFPEVFDPMLNNANIGSQLPFFGIVSGQPLLTCVVARTGRCKESQYEKSENPPIKRMFVLLIAGFSGIGGMYSCVFVAQRRRLRWRVLGILLLAISWAIIVFQDDLLSLSENAPASFGSFGASAPTYGRAEDVRVISVVVSELELGDIQRQIFAADLVEAAHDPALKQRPKAVYRLGVHNAVDVLSSGVIDGTVIVNLIQRIVSRVLVSRDQTYFFGYSLTDESVECPS